MRILIAPDKFKGSLTAREAAAALADGWKAGARGQVEIECLPVADGGEGTLEALGIALDARTVRCSPRDALGRPVAARFALANLSDGCLGIVEASESIGLWRIAPTERDLSRSSSFGMGEILCCACKAGAGRLLAGIGGSATNDGGTGMAAALGFRFLDSGGRTLSPVPSSLPDLERIVPPVRLPFSAPIVVACDVQNPLLGQRGATRVYSLQKGLKNEGEAERLEAGLERLAEVAARTFGADYRDAPGAGAAGGLGFGLATFCEAKLRPGFDLLAEFLRLDAAIERADVVVTGEGCLDAQTLEGKAPAGVARRARRLGKPVIAFAGCLQGGPDCLALFDEVIELESSAASRTDAMTRAAELLRRAARQTAGRRS